MAYNPYNLKSSAIGSAGNSNLDVFGGKFGNSQAGTFGLTNVASPIASAASANLAVPSTLSNATAIQSAADTIAPTVPASNTSSAIAPTSATVDSNIPATTYSAATPVVQTLNPVTQSISGEGVGSAAATPASSATPYVMGDSIGYSWSGMLNDPRHLSALQTLGLTEAQAEAQYQTESDLENALPQVQNTQLSGATTSIAGGMSYTPAYRDSATGETIYTIHTPRGDFQGTMADVNASDYGASHAGTIYPGGGEVSTAGGGSQSAGDRSTWTLAQLTTEYGPTYAQQLYNQYHPAGTAAARGAGTGVGNISPGGQVIGGTSRVLPGGESYP